MHEKPTDLESDSDLTRRLKRGHQCIKDRMERCHWGFDVDVACTERLRMSRRRATTASNRRYHTQKPPSSVENQWPLFHPRTPDALLTIDG